MVSPAAQVAATPQTGIPFASVYDMRMSVSRRKDAEFDRDVAAYTLAEAARYVRLPAATLRSWVLGGSTPEPMAVAIFRR